MCHINASQGSAGHRLVISGRADSLRQHRLLPDIGVFLLNLPGASVPPPAGPAIALICYSTCFYSTQL